MAEFRTVRRLCRGLIGGLFLAASASGQTPVGGGITVDTTWALADSPFQITANVSVSGGATLTIEPGVVVLGSNNTTLQVSDGHLSAIGTGGSPILFTSTADSGPEQWDGILVTGGSASADFAFCEIRYAGQPNAFAIGSGLAISNSATVTIANCTVRDCSGAPPVSSAVWMSNSAMVSITDSLFEANGDQLSDFAVRDQGAASLIVTGCHFSLNAGRAALLTARNVGGFSMNSFASNGFDRAGVAIGSTIDGGGMRAQMSGFEGFELASGELTIPAGTVFTIDAGTSVFGLDSNSELVVVGRIECFGTSALPIVMTSFDDTGATIWDGLTFSGGNASGLLRWTNIRRGGGGNIFAIRSNVTAVNTGLIRFENCSFSDIGTGGLDYGVYASTANLEIVSSDFRSCGDATSDFAYHAIGATGSTVLQNCLFENNVGQCAAVQPGSVQGVSGCAFVNNSVPRVRVNIGNTSAGGFMEAMTGLDCWELASGEVTVPSGSTLTIGPGAWVCGLDENSELQVQGRLECLGTAAQPIVMTSFDDTISTRWDGISFNGANSSGLLRWTSIRRGGGGNIFAVRSNISAVNSPNDIILEDCTVSDIAVAGADYGIYNSNSLVSCVRTLFRNCGSGSDDFGYYAVAASGGTLLEDCVFEDNMGQCARVQAGSLQNVTGGMFANNAFGRIRIVPGNTAIAGAMEHIPGMDGWETDAGDVVVPSGSVLTMGPGVRVYGLTNSAEFQVQGHLECLGTELDPIFMTSFDDTDATIWGGVTFNGVNASGLLRWTNIRRGGGGNIFAVRSNISAVNSPNDIVLEDCTISDINSGGTDYGVYNSNSHMSFLRTVFARCGDGDGDFGYFSAAPGGSVSLVECAFQNSLGACALVQANSLQNIFDCSFSGNAANRIRIRPGVTSASSEMAAMTGLEGWEIDSGDAVVPSGGVLRIDPGVTVFGRGDNSELQVQGRLECLGTEADPILMTSFDDTDATRWGGITFNGGNSSGLMQWTTVRRAGGGNIFAVRSNISGVNSPDLVIQHCVISDMSSGSNDSGLYLSNSNVVISDSLFERCGVEGSDSAGVRILAGTVRIEDCVFNMNPVAGLRVQNGTLSLSCTSFTSNAIGLLRNLGTVFSSECSFEGNTVFAVENTNANSQLNICCSWWGDPTGPGGPGGSGLGDPVSASVGFSPFSISPDACGFDCLAGDANNDGSINLADLNLVLANFGDSVDVGRDGDVNDDGQVNLADLNLVLAGFGNTCAASV